ncbi:hypothetical protein Tco_1160315 [Tanacetum coccineum]
MLEFTSEYGIPDGLHPELPGPEETIVEFPEGKVGVYTKFFEFANFRIPISQFLFDILGYYQIHLSQLSVIGVAKVSHIEINYRVLNIIPLLNLFCVFYIPSYNSGWMSFSKRPGRNTPIVLYKTPGLFEKLEQSIFLDMDLFNLISASNPTKVKTGTCPRAAQEVPLLTVTASRVIEMEDAAVASESLGTPSTIEKSPLDFANEDPP